MSTKDIVGICERDIDLLLLEELLSTNSFQTWFAARALGPGKFQLISAKRSVFMVAGESDLEVIFADSSGKKICVLVENKVAAGLQRNQAARYRERGEDHVAKRQCSKYVTVLTAPSRYFGKGLPSMKGFDKALTYEALADWMEQASELGERRKYKLALLKAAIDKGGSGYEHERDNPMTQFWRDYYEYARDYAPELEMKYPESKASRATFIYFRPPEFPKGVEICHKFKHGFVDFQLNGFGNSLNKVRGALAGHMPPKVKLEQAGGSAALRMEVPQLNPSRPFKDQATEARAGLGAAREFFRWYQETAAQLLRPLLSNSK